MDPCVTRDTHLERDWLYVDSSLVDQRGQLAAELSHVNDHLQKPTVIESVELERRVNIGIRDNCEGRNPGRRDTVQEMQPGRGLCFLHSTPSDV